MELSDEITIPGKRKDVFAKLIDPEILKECIPGCEELSLTDENKYSAKVVLKIGPIKAKFSGSVELDVANAPARLTLSGAGEGGVAGFAKGGAEAAGCFELEHACSHCVVGLGRAHIYFLHLTSAILLLASYNRQGSGERTYGWMPPERRRRC